MAKTHPRLRWGLIGASDIAATTMIAALRRTGQRIVTVMSHDADRAQQFADEHEIPTLETSLEPLLASPQIDAVYISSRNEQHAEQVMAAARAGKHILCEKPLAESISLARVAVQACDRAKVVLAVNHHLAASGAHVAVRELVLGGAIGDPLSISIGNAKLLPERLRSWRLGASPGAGVLLDLTCHDASVANELALFPARDVVALGAHQGGWGAGRPDAAMTTVSYGGDVLAHFHDAFTSPFSQSFLDVHGTHGSIRAENVMDADPRLSVRLLDASGRRDVRVPELRSPYDLTIEAFCRAVAGDGRPVVDGAAGFAALAVAIAAADSITLGTRQEVARLNER